MDERAPRAGRRFGCVADSCGALPFGFPPICAPQGHGGERLITGPRPCAGPANMRRGVCSKFARSYGVAHAHGPGWSKGSRTLDRKGAAIIGARRGALSVGHGLTVPPFWVGASLLCSSGIFPRPRIAGRIGRPLYSRTHSPGTPCGCSDFPGAYNRQGRAVSGGLYGARPQCWGLGTPSPSLKRAEG